MNISPVQTLNKWLKKNKLNGRKSLLNDTESFLFTALETSLTLKHLLRMGTSWQMHRFRHTISTNDHLWRLEFNYISVFKSCLFRHEWVTLTYLTLLPGCFWQSTLSLSLSRCQSPSLVPSLEKQQEKQRLRSELWKAPAKPHPTNNIQTP